MNTYLSPLKGESKNSDDYPYRIDMARLTSHDHLDLDLSPDFVDAINSAKGNVGTFFMVVAGHLIYQLAFSDPDDAMLFKLRFVR